jgi:signal transduction histidine kinase
MKGPSFLRVPLEGVRHHLILARRIKTVSDTAQYMNTTNSHGRSEQQKFELLKSQVLSIMSHELRTPLHIISGHLSLLIDGIRGKLNDDVRYGLTKAMEASGQMLSLVNNLVDLAFLSAGNVNVQRGVVELGPFLEEVAQRWAARVKDRSLVLLKEISPSLPQIETNERYLRRILDNLLDNALKFTAEGKITLGACSRGDVLEFWVADTGIGISREAQQFIFDDFRQGDSSETRAYGGMGLGLALSKKLASLLGGRIEVESELGKGSTFRVILPRENPFAGKDSDC